MLHHMPGLPLMKPGRRPMEYVKLRSKWLVSMPDGAVDP